MKRKYLVITLLMATSLAYGQQNKVLKYAMDTRWTEKVDPGNVWTEYPRPQMTRDSYINLNGYWQYAIQPTTKKPPKKYKGKILVPFAVESSLGGVKKLVGEENYLWYKRTFEAPELGAGERLLLHFGAVDWEAQVSINGKEAGLHKGGYDAFTLDITDHLQPGEQELVVRVWDPADKGAQPRGKQVAEPFGIWYTPVTGIWQTVWLEKVPANYITLLKPTPDIDKRQLSLKVKTNTAGNGLKLRTTVLAEGSKVSEKTVAIQGKEPVALLDIPQPRLWSPEDPYLYDLVVELVDGTGQVVDKVGSYFGMRKISLAKDAKGYTRIHLNNQPLFQFGLLDQGWWPDGLYTPPTEEAMMYDVKMTKEMGFNMLRKHVKVESARFYYHCDKMGMLVWQDMPNGNYLKGLRIQAWEPNDADRPKESAEQFEEELKEMMDEFHHFPSILVWVPFNEGWGQYDTERITAWTEQYDPSRLIDSPSGWADRGVGDIIDVHLYPGPGMEAPTAERVSVLGEFGGLGHPVEGHLWWDKRNWGYLTFNDKTDFVKEFEALIEGLKGPIASGLSAAIYTQTTDVEGEVNGLITYDRELVKIDPAEVKRMVTPLYHEYWAPYVLVPSSEHDPAQWCVSTEPPHADWKKADYDDHEWPKSMLPLSTYDNFFLGKHSPWTTDKVYLRKQFYLNTVPSTLYLQHYSAKSKMKVYLNGEVIFDHADRGGRKRHYTHIDKSQYSHLLKKGNNALTVELERTHEQASFDLGLYTTGSMEGNDQEDKKPYSQGSSQK